MSYNKFTRKKARLCSFNKPLNTGQRSPSLQKEIFNFTTKTLYVSEQMGFKYELKPIRPDKEQANLSGLVIIKFTFMAPSDDFVETMQRSLNLFEKYKGKLDEDINSALSVYVQNNPGYLDHVSRVTYPKLEFYYLYDTKEMVEDEAVILEDMGFQLELKDDRPLHKDNINIRESLEELISDSNDVDPKHKPVSFYTQFNLIDRKNKVDYVYANVLGKAIRISNNKAGIHDSVDGLYIKSYNATENGGVHCNPTEVIELDELTEKNGFYRSKIDAENSANLDMIKRKMDTELYKDKKDNEKSKIDLEMLRLRLDKEKAKLDIDRSKIEEAKVAMESRRVTLEESKINSETLKHYRQLREGSSGGGLMSILEKAAKGIGFLTSIVLGSYKIFGLFKGLFTKLV